MYGFRDNYDVALVQPAKNHGSDALIVLLCYRFQCRMIEYVILPFGIVELISRIRAVLRRSGRQSTETNLYTYGTVSLDQEKHIVTVDGKPCHLTVKEFELLRYLLVNTDIVLKREQIMEAVWGFTYEGESRTIDMHIKSLRQKLGDGGKIIHTVRGVGYVIGGNV